MPDGLIRWMTNKYFLYPKLRILFIIKKYLENYNQNFYKIYYGAEFELLAHKIWFSLNLGLEVDLEFQPTRKYTVIISQIQGKQLHFTFDRET